MDNIILDINGGVLMTTEQILQKQHELCGKTMIDITSFSDYGDAPFTFIGVCTDKNIIKQKRKNLKCACLLPNFLFITKNEKGEEEYVNTHETFRYFVFNDFEIADKASKLLKKLHDTICLKTNIEHLLKQHKDITLFNDNVEHNIYSLLALSNEYLTKALNACDIAENNILNKLK